MMVHELFTKGVAVTPSDADNLSMFPAGIYVGGAGDVAVETEEGSTLTFSGVPAGTLLPIKAKKVLATGTTATLILALR